MSLEVIREKADAIFSQKQKDFPILYSEQNRVLFQEFFIDGYLEGLSDGQTKAIDSFSSLLKD